MQWGWQLWERRPPRFPDSSLLIAADAAPIRECYLPTIIPLRVLLPFFVPFVFVFLFKINHEEREERQKDTKGG
ncbi:protein-S-isoprenylcysteine O-methyltransferase Ste14 [Natronospira proteinivora]|uniref:Protein-S-isoprenylcysteine O-methyltransferase Ste14 n=1 Tax=Natronospira proteinivora TaxID=1807133 RepID=A0ABT1G754_9GAMM|nr:protein-S-isoprenylcysteine O-methyltransferase Ste14 [Natronospira proteinivora]